MNTNIRNRAGIAGLVVVISLAVCLAPVRGVTGNSGESSRIASIQASAQIASLGCEGDEIQGTRPGRFHDLLPAMLNMDILNDLSFGRPGYGTFATAGASAQSKAAGGKEVSPQSAFTIPNPTPITINDGAFPPTVATPYPSTITVSGVTNPIAKVTVTLNNISHTFPDDIDILLVGPTGAKTILMSDVGGGHPGNSGKTLMFDDTASSSLPDDGPIVSGTFRPTDVTDGGFAGFDTFPAPAPPGGYTATLSVFAGTIANGTWSLYVVDDTGVDAGIIADGWSLTISDTVVTTINDSGPGSLRQAILDANAYPDVNTISFNIPGAGLHTITPTTALPVLTAPVIIDGYTQPGASSNTLPNGDNAVILIELNGTSAGAGVAGLSISASGCTVKGLVINRFDGDGIYLPGAANVIQGNFIGTDNSGMVALGNNRFGVFIDSSATNNTVGGTSAGARNIISGNIATGLVLNSNSNSVQNNFIGTDLSGTGALRNLSGVFIGATCSGNTIGGGVGAGNKIAFNVFAGIELSSTAGTGNAIFANSVFSNGDLGIDLGNDGITPNDPLDADTGPNNLQNFPVLTSAISNTGNNTTTIIGSLDSTPSSTFTLQFFSNPSCDSSGNGEGKTYLGSNTVTTTIDGNPASFIVALSPAVPVGQVVTATATNNGTRDTSEFSACRTVTSDSPTAVDDPEFAATAYDDGVLLHWQTGLEINNLGFNVHRDEGGKVSLVNSQLIAGSAFLVGSDVILGSGHSYQWWDNAPAGKSTTYWLEDRDINGQSRWHGPFHIDQIARGQLPPSVQQARTLASLSMTEAHSFPAESRAGLAAASSSAGQVQSLIASSPNTVKLQVKREAWYRVSAQELFDAGLDRSVDPRSLQLFVDGKQQAISVTGQDDGRFDPDDTVEFYGIGIDSPFADLRTYYLIAGKQAGLRISNLQSPAHPAPGGSFEFTVERRDRTIYFSGLLNGDKENFFGAVVASQPVNQALTLNHLAASALPATLRVGLQGVTNFSHVVAVRLNGSDVGQLVFQSQAEGETTIAVSPSLLREGENQVTLITQGGPSDLSLVDYFQLSYQHRFSADDGALKLGASAGQQLTIDGFASDQIQVFDVTDPSAVQEVTGDVSKDENGVFSVSLIVGGKGQRSLLALTKERAARVAKVVPDYPSLLRDPHQGADLLIICQRQLFEPVGELRELRQKQGLSVAVADIEDIYDEFSYGQKTPYAVKDFIGFAKTQWKKPVRYVLFFGDASLDPKNYLGLGDFDFVPTRLIDTTFMETASDDWLADFDNDGIADVAIGRLPVRTVAEAQAMIDKLAAYEQSDAAEEALLVSDRNDGYNFEAANAALKPVLPADVRALEVKRGQLGDQATKAAVIDGINRGQRIVNYAGHGNVNTWRGNVFNSTDALQLQNREHLAMFVIMNCLNGYFQDPALDSLAESLLKSAEGGAVAVWASSSMTFADGQAVMNPEFYRQVFSLRARLGDAAMRAKAITFDGDVRRTWILLGDPTMRLK